MSLPTVQNSDNFVFVRSVKYLRRAIWKSAIRWLLLWMCAPVTCCTEAVSTQILAIDAAAYVRVWDGVARVLIDASFWQSLRTQSEDETGANGSMVMNMREELGDLDLVRNPNDKWGRRWLDSCLIEFDYWSWLHWLLVADVLASLVVPAPSHTYQGSCKQNRVVLPTPTSHIDLKGFQSTGSNDFSIQEEHMHNR